MLKDEFDDLFAECDGALHRVVAFVPKAFADPALVEKKANEPQTFAEGDDTLQSFELAWADAYLSMFDEPEIADFVSSYRPLSNSKLGGRQEVLWLNHQKPSRSEVARRQVRLGIPATCKGMVGFSHAMTVPSDNVRAHISADTRFFAAAAAFQDQVLPDLCPVPHNPRGKVHDIAIDSACMARGKLHGTREPQWLSSMFRQPFRVPTFSR